MNEVYKLITYGCGDAFDPALFKPAKNSNTIFRKPNGGLWASPINSKWGWREWGETNDWGDFTSQFVFTFVGKVVVIDSLFDLERLPWIDDGLFRGGPDIERLTKMGFDAIHLTERGEESTKFTMPRNLYGWDCETVFILNSTGVIENENQGADHRVREIREA